ncbi:uncharacterized protein Z518_11272 [Rhinocladiella mackenziei CBS 650.93]|uniref:Uncharacterized protein n=1 Tax=Rhinocladiella mackenziei CBS 650.93 TaxID=1442369 RepID=A0A0D2I1F3_9EURO|nr:uncharacterized protein Z518_11272 [Rhinocladiella mackenziei CBS 650.93]KIW99533.1 hypothetical protein Z518_11272 [Rhinocladiella mackenziei CBS 650.93]
MSTPKRTINGDGIELHLATNHIGHFLLTNLIMPKLFQAPKISPKGATSVVNVSSGTAEVAGIRWSDIGFEKKSKERNAQTTRSSKSGESTMGPIRRTYHLWHTHKARRRMYYSALGSPKDYTTATAY